MVHSKMDNLEKLAASGKELFLNISFQPDHPFDKDSFLAVRSDYSYKNRLVFTER
jgi:hypothetical protein